MENRGLLFIPDISGFTRFVNETEIEHSRQIIQKLAEIKTFNKAICKKLCWKLLCRWMAT